MTPAEHYAEAERWLSLAEAAYEARTAGGHLAVVAAAGIAQAHAALGRADDPTGCLWERPADDPEPVPEGCEGTRAGRRWPQDHAEDVTVVGPVLTDEPGPDVTEVIDFQGNTWQRSGSLWECVTSDEAANGGRLTWAALRHVYDPLRAAGGGS